MISPFESLHGSHQNQWKATWYRKINGFMVTLPQKMSVVLIAGILPHSSRSVRSAAHQIISADYQCRFELRGRTIVTGSSRSQPALLCFLRSAGGKEGAGTWGSLGAFAPSNGCGSLSAVSVLISPINSGFLPAAADAAHLPGGGPAAAQQAAAAPGGPEAGGVVSPGPGGAQRHRERNTLLRHLGCFLHHPD